MERGAPPVEPGPRWLGFRRDDGEVDLARKPIEKAGRGSFVAFQCQELAHCGERFISTLHIPSFHPITKVTLQLLTGVEEARSHGPDVALHDAGDLFVLQALDVVQGNNHSMFL